MLILIIALVIVAGLVLAPDVLGTLKTVKPAAAPPDPTPTPDVAAPAAVPPATPDSREAIDSLLIVRQKLQAGGELTPETARAVDQLWLDLLHEDRK